MSLPSTITNVSHIEQVNNNNDNDNESYVFSNNRSNWSNENNNQNENENENNNNNSTITQESYNEENSNNNLPFPMNLTKIYRRKSRKMAQTRKARSAQRGGSKIPGVSNVVRITGTTLKKIGNVGIYGLKKVGNGVHVITHVVNRGVTAVTGRNMMHRGKTAKKAKKGKKQH